MLVPINGKSVILKGTIDILIKSLAYPEVLIMDYNTNSALTSLMGGGMKPPMKQFRAKKAEKRKVEKKPVAKERKIV